MTTSRADLDESVASWRGMLAAVSAPEARLKIFVEAAGALAGYINDGLERADVADELADMAGAYLPDVAADQIQSIIAAGFAEAAARERGAKPGGPPPLTLAEWLARELPEPDFLLGSWLTTTSRVLINAPTGIGKTLFGIGLDMGISAGSGFLHWRGIRPARVLFVDGEMSRRLLKQRLTDEAARLGVGPVGMHVLSHEDIPDFAPLSTPKGQAQIEAQIKRMGGADLIMFDNIMSLIGGDHKDEEGWRNTLPWARSLTRRCIGQVSIHHTGHDETRGYGTKTREWQMDTVLHLEEVKRPDTDVSFQITFRKARERAPATRADFVDVRVALVNDRWTSLTAATGTKGKVSPLTKKFYDALVNATVGNGDAKMFNCPAATVEEWRAECLKIGLLDKDKDKRKNASALFSKSRLALIAANWIACNETAAWTLPN